MNLNLARKWRSNTFDRIIGQDISLRMLKNSLYLQHYFPVYLFSGQRGCGKTTTARVFAAALNCQQLTLFQQDPKKYTVPCLHCSSCQAMAKTNHPDFIEIDAASHTGVDNVRTIIEAASLLPVLGAKKIYLIDEAHMLSKAAFNAFLKILEEPPRNVVFILATTDPHKIIDTVRSRCFQLFFPPILIDNLVEHLQEICTQEKIAFEIEGLHLIARQSQGSVRDALNMIEQVRFASSSITKKAVYEILGFIDEKQLLDLFEAMMHSNTAEVVAWFSQTPLDAYSPEKIWYSFLNLMRALLWYKVGNKLSEYDNFEDHFKQLSDIYDNATLIATAQFFYDNELLFLKTTQQHRFFEMLVVRITQRKISQLVEKTPVTPVSIQKTDNNSSKSSSVKITHEKSTQHHSKDERWSNFVSTVETLQDPLLTSIFKQGSFIRCNEELKQVEVSFAKDFSFFQEWLDNTSNVWQPVLRSLFGAEYSLMSQFEQHTATQEVKKVVPVQQPVQTAQKAATTTQPIRTQESHQWTKQSTFKKKQNEQTIKMRTSPVNVSDEQLWKKTHMILKFFPGTVSEVHDS